jgi:uncharacterized protein YcbX
MTPGTVSHLAYAAVKGTALTWPRSVEIGPHGIPADREFHLLDADRGQLGADPRTLRIRSAYDPATGVMTMQVPGFEPLSGPARSGELVRSRVAWDGDRPIESHRVDGPWCEPLARYLERDVVLARPVEARRAVDVSPITLLSMASVRRVERRLGAGALDPGRFRMNVYLEGLEEHEEDGWYGRRVAIGDAVLRIAGPVPRCAVVTYHPGTGERDAPVLRAIVQDRPSVRDPRSGAGVDAPLGVYADVVRPGRVGVGDEVEVLAARV